MISDSLYIFQNNINQREKHVLLFIFFWFKTIINGKNIKYFSYDDKWKFHM